MPRKRSKSPPKKKNMSYRDRLQDRRDDRRDNRDDRRDSREERRDDRRDDREERHETGITRWEQNQQDGTGIGSGNVKDFFIEAAKDIGGTLIGPFVGELTGSPELGLIANNIYGNWNDRPRPPRPQPGQPGGGPQTTHGYHTGGWGNPTPGGAGGGCSCQTNSAGAKPLPPKPSCMELAQIRCDMQKRCAGCCPKRKNTKPKCVNVCKKGSKASKTKGKGKKTKGKTTKKKTPAKKKSKAIVPKGIMSMCYR